MKPRMEAADKLDQDEGDNLVENGTSTVTVEDINVLVCRSCLRPLEPPIFQCIQGHVVCSPCREKVIAGAVKKCKACGVAVGSYQIRCRDMERVVESVRVACAHASHGCVARVTYYDRRRHGKACPYAPYGCPIKGCGFVGAVGALLDHLSGVHPHVDAIRRFWKEDVGDAMDKLQLSLAADEVRAKGVGVEGRGAGP